MFFSDRLGGPILFSLKPLINSKKYAIFISGIFHPERKLYYEIGSTDK